MELELRIRVANRNFVSNLEQISEEEQPIHYERMLLNLRDNLLEEGYESYQIDKAIRQYGLQEYQHFADSE